MKSKLFSKHDVKMSESFSKDFKKLIALKGEVRNKFPNLAFEYLKTTTEKDLKEIIEKEAKNLKIRETDFKSVLSLTKFFLDSFMSKDEAIDDRPEDIVNDLITEFELDDSLYGELLDYFKTLKTLSTDKSDSIIFYRSKLKHALPTIETVETFVDFRVVYNEDYSHEDDPNSYFPKCLGTIPFGIVRLSLSGDNKDPITFEVSNDVILVFINYLNALQKKIEVAKIKMEIDEV